MQPGRLQDLPTPALLIEARRLQRNVAAMQAHADQLGVRLRPHLKTHKCVPIARLQRDRGARGAAVATLAEAEVFAGAGIEELVWAFPLVRTRVDRAVELARAYDLRLLVDSSVAAGWLQGAPPLRVWIKVDCGYHRAGVDPGEEEMLAVARTLAAAGHRVDGVLSHSGDAYTCAGEAVRRRIAEAEARTLTAAADRLRTAGFPVEHVSAGSTPGTSAARDLAGVTEVRPGNYVFYDLMQVRFGVCTPAECALTVLASVVSCGAGHAVCDAGALALSKDPGVGEPTMGAVYADAGASRLSRRQRLVALSQEHGKLAEPARVGSLLRILPNHACLTAACFDHAWLVDGERVLERWPIERRRG